MTARRRRRTQGRPKRHYFLIVLASLIAAGALAAWRCNPRLTEMVQGPKFHAELDKQTSKGLHFTGTYGELKRTGVWTAEATSFHGDDGQKAIKSLTAEMITATFNPWGVFVRRWQLDSVEIAKGRVEIQKYEPKPPEPKNRPWYGFLMPDRVYLRRVTCPDTDVVWKIREREGGIYQTHLLIQPHGRDFDYTATGGTFRMPFLPPLPLKEIRMVITKELLSLYAMDLAPTEESSIHVEGTNGLKEDKSVKAEATFERVPVSPWLPDDWKGAAKGVANGEVHWEGKDTKIESSGGNGYVEFIGIRLANIPFLEIAAAATKNAELKEIRVDECSLDFAWQGKDVTVRDLRLAADNAFQLRGTIKLEDGRLSGTLELGVRPDQLNWLPKAHELIFTRTKDDLWWTTVKLGGTLREPTNDLTPRLAEALRKDPAAATGVFLRGFGEWMEQKFKAD